MDDSFQPYSRVLQQYLRHGQREVLTPRLPPGLERSLGSDGFGSPRASTAVDRNRMTTPRSPKPIGGFQLGESRPRLDAEALMARAAIRKATRALEEQIEDEYREALRAQERKELTQNRQVALSFVSSMLPPSYRLKNHFVLRRYNDSAHLNNNDLDWLTLWRRSGLVEKVEQLGAPDEAGRLSILQVHAAKAMVDQPELVLPYVAARTEGFSAAELVNIIDEAVIAAAKAKTTTATSTHFEEATNAAIAARTALAQASTGDSVPASTRTGRTTVLAQKLMDDSSLTTGEQKELRVTLASLVGARRLASPRSPPRSPSSPPRSPRRASFGVLDMGAQLGQHEEGTCATDDAA